MKCALVFVIFAIFSCSSVKDNSTAKKTINPSISGAEVARIFSWIEIAKEKTLPLYKEALERNRFSRGIIIFEGVIEPNGNYTEVLIVENEVLPIDLESRFIEIVQNVRFEKGIGDRRKQQIKFNYLPKFQDKSNANKLLQPTAKASAE